MRRGVSYSIVGALALVGAGMAWKAPGPWKSTQPPISTGRSIDPVGEATEVGSFPTNMALSPNGKWLATTCTGTRATLSILDAETGKVVSQRKYPEGLYYGLAFGSDSELYVSQGAEDRVDLLSVSESGELGEAKSFKVPGKIKSLAANPAGIALSDDHSTLLLANNQSGIENQYQGNITSLNAKTGEFIARTAAGGFPFGVVQKGGSAYVSSERDDTVFVFDPVTLAQKSAIAVGSHPTGMAFDSTGKFLYVANSSSDTISVIDTAAQSVVRAILVRPAEVHGLPGCTPLGLALSPDGKTLFAACADLNAVAVIDLESGSVKGYLPTGWYPTAIQITPDGKRLFVSCGKGVKSRNPNGKPVGSWGQYILSVMEGAVTKVDLPNALTSLSSLTQVALKDALVTDGLQAKNTSKFFNPGFKHVIYIIKENRTYDQILGDLPEGSGDASLALYGHEVTPNTHALAKRFGVFDNFFVCAEVSADGWNWSTGGMTSEYTNRNTIYNYTHGKRSYDFEGEVNGSPVELLGQKDVATPPGGYIWDLCADHGVSYRTYGSFVAFADSEEKRPDGKPLTKKNEAVKKALVGHSDDNFRQFDMAYPDSEAGIKLGIPPAPRQMKAYGSFASPSRFSQWKREFDHFVANGDLPSFSLLRFPRDHTSGGASGLSSPRAMVADSDYAVGQLVEAVSHSKYWKDTAICVVEDDAQNGFDHVDAHRSPVLIISAYNKPGGVDHGFYNTDSVLRTMELCLGLPPMNQFDALSNPFNIFSRSAVNEAPYEAVLPAKEIVGEVNKRTTYRSRESEVYVATAKEDSDDDVRLNEILWRIAKGRNAELPKTPGAQTAE